MKTLIAAIALTIALPAAANAQANHAQHHAEHQGTDHGQEHQDCCKHKNPDGSPMDCCKEKDGKRPACCEKHEQHKGDHSGHDMSKH